MTAYKLKIEDYVSRMPGQPDTTVNVREALALILMAPALELSAQEALRNHRLAMRILEAEGPAILLDADAHARICAARDKLKGWSWADMELLNRIENMDEVEVEERR